MEALQLIGILLLATAATAFVLSVLAPQETVQEFLENLMVFIQGPAAMLRDGTAAALQTTWSWVRQAGRSVGIAGPHWVQRLVGVIIIPAIALLGIVVGTLNLMAVVGGVFGSMADTLLEQMPVSLELLTAAELMAAALLFGMLLLDTLGITHMTSFFAFQQEDAEDEAAQQGDAVQERPETEADGSDNADVKRYVFMAIFALGTAASVALFALSGVMRDSLLFPEATQTTVTEAPTSPPTSLGGGAVVTPGGGSGMAYDGTFDDAAWAYEEDPGVPARYERAAGLVLIGIPTISVAAGIFAGVGFIAAGALLLTFPVFLLTGATMGPLWVVGFFLARMVDLLYNFLIVIFNIFGGLGAFVRGLFVALGGWVNGHVGGQPQDLPGGYEHAGDGAMGDVNPPAPPEPAPAPAPEPQPAPGPDPEPEPQPEPAHDLYGADDPNWNPLAEG